MNVNIDNKSGFCSGVTSVINAAESELKISKQLFCLGDLVHNSVEMDRLRKCGLEVISYKQFKELRDEQVLIRAHGEPPETYRIARKNNLKLLDYSCPVVIKLQKNIKEGYANILAVGGQIVIYGKPGHAEVIGLNGQIDDNAIIVSTPNNLSGIDFSKPIMLFSQTTKDESGFFKLSEKIKKLLIENGLDIDKDLIIHNTICRSVSQRVPQLKKFSSEHDVIVFVSGIKSSNGQYLYSICKNTNKRTYFVSGVLEIEHNWFSINDNVGICGATSTPMWLMKEIAEKIKSFYNNDK